MEERCYGCMKEKTAGPVCEHCGFDERQENELHQLPLGTVLGEQYIVGKVLGQGGFGITYLGWNRNLDMPVAIKEFFPRGLSGRDHTSSCGISIYDQNHHEMFQANKKRFLQEARVLVKLEKVPQIVRVWNFFEENNTAYIIMEYVDGRTLREFTGQRGKRLRPDDLLHLLKPVFEALVQVHAMGYVHRDISPDNIMLLPGGNAKLLDFGAVRYVEKAEVDKALSHSTQAILKHGFAPIEQYQSRGSLGPWTDVYALCATIYFCLTGQVPPEAGARIMDGAELDWETIPGLNHWQIEALKKGMEPLPKNRTASVKELYDGLYGMEEIPAPVIIPKKKPAPEAPEKSLPPTPVRPEKVTAPLDKERQIPPELLEEKKPEGSRSKPEKTKPTSEKRAKWPLLAMAAVLALIMLVIPRVVRTDEVRMDAPAAEQTQPLDREPETTVPETTQFVAREENILMANADEETAFRTGVSRKEIVSMTFLDTLANVPENAVDASQLKNGRVMAWTVKNGEGCDLYIAAEGGVYAPEDAGKLFRNMSKLETVSFGNGFFTENVRNMEEMFYFCSGLRELDLSGFDTRNVTSMRRMFYGCRLLKKLDVSSFETGAVTTMASMFDSCNALAALDLRNFDTGSVVDMKGMFYGCWKLQQLDVSGFRTENVTNMEDMFHGCKALAQLNVSGFAIQNVTAMDNMFYDCPAPWPSWYKKEMNKGIFSMS